MIIEVEGTYMATWLLIIYVSVTQLFENLMIDKIDIYADCQY